MKRLFSLSILLAGLTLALPLPALARDVPAGVDHFAIAGYYTSASSRQVTASSGTAGDKGDYTYSQAAQGVVLHWTGFAEDDVTLFGGHLGVDGQFRLGMVDTATVESGTFAQTPPDGGFTFALRFGFPATVWESDLLTAAAGIGLGFTNDGDRPVTGGWLELPLILRAWSRLGDLGVRGELDWMLNPVIYGENRSVARQIEARGIVTWQMLEVGASLRSLAYDTTTVVGKGTYHHTGSATELGLLVGYVW